MAYVICVRILLCYAIEALYVLATLLLLVTRTSGFAVAHKFISCRYLVMDCVCIGFAFIWLLHSH